MKKPLFYEHLFHKNDFAFIDGKGRDNTAYRVCRTRKNPKTFSTLEEAKQHLETEGYNHNPRITAMF